MRFRSLNQASRVRNCGRDCLRTTPSPPDSSRSTRLETPPLKAAKGTEPAPTQLQERRYDSALSVVISNMPIRCGCGWCVSRILPQEASAVDIEDRAVDEAGCVARQKHD